MYQSVFCLLLLESRSIFFFYFLLEIRMIKGVTIIELGTLQDWKGKIRWYPYLLQWKSFYWGYNMIPFTFWELGNMHAVFHTLNEAINVVGSICITLDCSNLVGKNVWLFPQFFFSWSVWLPFITIKTSNVFESSCTFRCFKSCSWTNLLLRVKLPGICLLHGTKICFRPTQSQYDNNKILQVYFSTIGS